LGDKVKEIADRDPDCEVDPAKVANHNDLDRNWRKLIGWTSECWKCIYQSVGSCPVDLRYIFRHIRSCAEERYGDFLKSVRYSSVSGFLFLRFFCPAILNPKLFGLLKGMLGCSAWGVGSGVLTKDTRSSEKQCEKNVYAYCEEHTDAGEYGEFWPEGAVDGAYEYVLDKSSGRVQGVSG
jgi:hypothetical protein